ncbi:hypothetical protein AZE42_03987 [Rhizopogon vesiculosus]|uniref:Uncharacterized protein n=1 Tax=Rhizopogon vesiculosus TaxID=180088 RepID=A0A1J8R7B7_9AGAM|nr:hypothetical protein AZE42_03987 [Rhizopogon vesiculosus]
MSDVPPFGAYRNLCSPEDDTSFDSMWEGLNFGQQQELSRSSYFNPVNSQMNHTDHLNVPMYTYEAHDLPGQPQFGYTIQDDPSKSRILRLDTSLGPPQLHVSDPSSSTSSVGPMIPPTPYNRWGADNHLQVYVPPGTPSSPSGVFSYAVSPTITKGLSPIPSPISPHSPAAIGSSDESSSLQAFDDDDEDPLQPMEHIARWKAIPEQTYIVTGTNIFIPQIIYQPYTEADRVRYIEKANLKEPILFVTSHPDQWGVSLDDALKAKLRDLHGRDDHMFENCGPSVSIRLQWPGYRSWTKQIPTMDFKSPKCPITKAKLAKNVANCVKRFIDEKGPGRMEMEGDRSWRVGTRYIRVEDLMLVSLHHISKGSWQPQLRLRTPLSEILQRRAPQVPPPGI